MWPPSRGRSGIKLKNPIKTLIVIKNTNSPVHPELVNSAPIRVAPTTDTTRPSCCPPELIDVSDPEKFLHLSGLHR